jgi:dGTPase
LRLNEDLIEAVALAHDLGHPPFGHAGESVLEECMAAHGHFEHNRQSLRVVDYLEHPYPAFRGLNLTRAVRECIALHRTRYDAPICRDFDPRLQPPLEGQVVDAADEIAYTSADLEDALAAEWITMGQLAGLELWRQAWETAERETPAARPIHKRIRACKAVLATLADDLIATTARQLIAPRARSVPSVPAPACVFTDPDDIRRAGRPLAAFSPPVARALTPLQEFLLHEVYLSPRAVQKDLQARTVVTDLFRAYVANPSLLPDRYRARIDEGGLHRTVCDYIAGMTDRFAIEQHAALRT